VFLALLLLALAGCLATTPGPVVVAPPSPNPPVVPVPATLPVRTLTVSAPVDVAVTATRVVPASPARQYAGTVPSSGVLALQVEQGVYRVEAPDVVVEVEILRDVSIALARKVLP
jgi:hypothetical protein